MHPANFARPIYRVSLMRGLLEKKLLSLRRKSERLYTGVTREMFATLFVVAEMYAGIF